MSQQSKCDPAGANPSKRECHSRLDNAIHIHAKCDQAGAHPRQASVSQPPHGRSPNGQGDRMTESIMPLACALRGIELLSLKKQAGAAESKSKINDALQYEPRAIELHSLKKQVGAAELKIKNNDALQ